MGKITGNLKKKNIECPNCKQNISFEIQIPHLRDRMDDIPILAQYFLDHYAEKYKKNITHISETTLHKMYKHSWPGNVRELQHCIERAVILSNSEVLQPEDFNFSASPGKDEGPNLESLNLEDVEKLLIRKVESKKWWKEVEES